MKKEITYAEIAEILKKLTEAVQVMAENEDAICEEETIEKITATPSKTPDENESTQEKEVPEEKEKKPFTREQLDSMLFNDLKKLAADMKLKPIGKREKITEAILSAQIDTSTQEFKGTQPIEEEPTVKPLDTKGGLKVPAKEEVEEEPQQELDELFEMVNSYSDSDLKEVLKSIGASALGKHESLVDKVIKAINEGKIANPLNEDEPEEETQDDVNNENDETLADIFPQFTVNYTEDITEARTETLQSIHEEVVNSENTYDESEMDELISGFLGDEYDPSNFTADDKVRIYAEIRKLYVDDEGVEHEDKEAYLLNNESYCCGAELMYSKKTKKFVCASCGNKYDAD